MPRDRRREFSYAVEAAVTVRVYPNCERLSGPRAIQRPAREEQDDPVLRELTAEPEQQVMYRPVRLVNGP